MTYKTCAHCGETRPVDMFRKYYNRPGLYAFCKMCEKVETRRKYLAGKIRLSVDEKIELDNIIKLYEYQSSLGLRSNKKSKVKVADIVAEQLSKKMTQSND